MYFSVREAKYAYEIKGEGPPLLLLHGFTGSQKTWAQLRKQLMNKFKVITIDLPGHGKTTSPPRTMEQCCDDLVDFLTYINVDHVHIIGYSMGGRVALSFAMQYPKLVTTLILESASPGIERAREREDRVANDERLAQKLEREGIVQFVNFWEDIPLFDTQRRLSSTVQQSIREERLSQQKEGLASSLRNMGTGNQPSWWSHLYELKCTTLLIVGADDHKFVTINEQMEKMIPKVNLVIVPNAGHAIHVEQPETFGKLVLSFL